MATGRPRVALRKESVDRNADGVVSGFADYVVALRKESVDRNRTVQIVIIVVDASLSARRAWIEITVAAWASTATPSLSARRAWIEITLPNGR